MTPETQKKTVQFIKLASQMLEALYKRAAEQDAREQKVAAQIPATVDALVQNGRLPEADREKAASVLKDPVSVLDVLARTAKHRTVEELTHLGSVDNGRAKSAGHNGNYLGSKIPAERESDKAWFASLGIR